VIAGLIASAPFLLVPALLVSGRAGALAAGLAGLAAAVVALILLRSADGAILELLARETLNGLWLSLQAVAFIIGGLFFYRCIRASEPGLFETAGATPTEAGARFDHRRLYWACFLLGPFAESATGFGVGMIIALPVILCAGVRGLDALAFSLFSQMLVAWGSLAVGSAIGAELAGVPFPQLALHSAWLQAPVLLGHLVVFWLLLVGIGHRPTATQAVDDLIWTILLGAALILCTAYVAPELGGLLATGVLLVARGVRDEPALIRRVRQVLCSAWPYAALTVILVATRTIPSLRAELQTLWTMRPLDGGVSIAPLYHPATSLVLVGLLAVFAARRTNVLGGVVVEVARLGWTPVLVTVVYVVFAQLVSAGGLARALADQVTSLVGAGAIYLAPLFGGLSGFLTGSNTASNGMMMPVQTALATTSDADLAWTAAMQNVAGSTLTMLSPTRIATGCALLALAGQDRAAYARTWPFAAVSPVVLVVCWALIA